MHRLRSVAARLGLLVIGGFVGLLLAEILLRAFGVAYPLPYYPDPHCGSRLRPGFQGWYTKEGRAFITVNSAGFRDREHTLTKPPGAVRIAVLGDSFAEALQVPLENTFWSVLQDELRRRRVFGERPVEVLNFGISGHGTAQQLQVLRHYVFDYQPDLVLLAFFAGNDVRNNSRQLESDQVKPFYEVSDGQLVLDEQFLQHPDYLKAHTAQVRFKVGVINASRLLQLVNEWKNRLANRSLQTGNDGPSVDVQALVEDADPHWQEAWDITERLIAEMHRESMAHSARFCVAMVTQDFQVDPDAARRAAVQRESGIGNLDAAETRISALGAQEGFPVICLAEEFRRYAESRSAYLHGFPNTRMGRGHWNETGHRLAGETIAAAIEAWLVAGSWQP